MPRVPGHLKNRMMMMIARTVRAFFVIVLTEDFKSVPPSQIMVFLGVLFNTTTMTIEVTPERLVEIKQLIQMWLGKTPATLKQIQSLLGKLNFVAACVRPSRIFVSRLLCWLRSIHGSKLQYHIIPEFVKKDLI